jgi:hypothetical protein
MNSINTQPKPVTPAITITITDERIISFFKDKSNDWIHPMKFIEKQILLGIEKAIQAPNTLVPEEETVNLPKNETEYKEFYKEYTDFLNQKHTLINSFKENLKMVENIRFENLEKSLSKRFLIKKETHTCDICKVRVFRNVKALSTHKRKCTKTNPVPLQESSGGGEPEEEEETEEESSV